MSGNVEFTLDKVEANVVGRALGAEVPRPPLRLGNTTTDPARLLKLSKVVTNRLAGRRLVVRGELHPDLHAAFRLFGDHRVAVSISGVDGHGADIAVLAFTDGARALRVTQTADDDLLFTLFSDDDLVAVLAAVLPAMQAASGSRTTVRTGTVKHRSAVAARRAAEREIDEEETSAFGNLHVVGKVRPSKDRTREVTDEERLRDALAAGRLGGGQITVSGNGGTPAQTLNWVDTEVGRYLIRVEEKADESLAHYEPASHDDVVRGVRRAVSAAY